MKPGPFGAHNWQPMSYSPQTGLVYIPAQDTFFAYLQDRRFQYRPGAWNTGLDFTIFKEPPPAIPTGHLLAWDPVAQKERWRVQYPIIWNGGLLSTAGNLVFQGTADGRFVAYSADKGEKLWEVAVGTGVIAAPMTYQVDGVQYVSVMAGWGGAFALTGGNATGGAIVPGRLLTFALHAKQALPEVAAAKPPQVSPIASDATPEKIDRGAGLFAQYCSVCHGLLATGGGTIADLRYSQPGIFDKYSEIVLDGKFSSVGMPSFKQFLTVDDIEAIRAYIIKRRADK
jgi:quinohemoprotein ethanol dehydrogenase